MKERFAYDLDDTSRTQGMPFLRAKLPHVNSLIRRDEDRNADEK